MAKKNQVEEIVKTTNPLPPVATVLGASKEAVEIIPIPSAAPSTVAIYDAYWKVNAPKVDEVIPAFSDLPEWCQKNYADGITTALDEAAQGKPPNGRFAAFVVEYCK